MYVIMGDMKAGEHLRNERKRRGLSMQQVAKRAGVSVSTIVRVELCQVSPRVDTVEKIESALGIRSSSVSSSKTSEPSGSTSLQKVQAVIDNAEWLSRDSKEFIRQYLVEQHRQYKSRKRSKKK